MNPSIAIVIPTRNRADLAIDAIRSLLAIADPRLRVIVSNNSSQPEHVQQLADFCERAADARLLHIRPPRSLAMAEHWDWAIQQTLLQSDATHIGLHYDRRLTKSALPLLFDQTTKWPERAITYFLDVVYPVPPRFYVHQMPSSGGVYEIETKRALHLAAHGLLTDRWQAFPVLVNCVTPRSIFERIRARFGDICVSTTPDACFGLRLSAIEDRYLHFDMAHGIHYAYARSNGLAYLRGEQSSPVFADFVSLLGDRPWLDAAPIPGLSLGQNIFWHEYALARRQSGEEKFPPVDMDAYLNDLARGLDAIGDPAKRKEARDVLVKHGWREEEPIAAPAPPPRGLRDRVRGKLSSLLRKVALLRADHLYATPADRSALGFKHEVEALRYAQQSFGSRIAENDFLELFEPVRLQ